LSLVEQWHAIIDHLGVSIQRMTLEHIMFFLVILMRDRYDQQAVKFAVDLESKSCTWPEDDPDEDIDHAEKSHDEVKSDNLADDCDEEDSDTSTGSGDENDDIENSGDEANDSPFTSDEEP